MEPMRDRAIIKQGILLLVVKTILGGGAAAAALGLMSVVGSYEIIVAVLIGLVPGIVEKSKKKFLYGILFGALGYKVGGMISASVAREFLFEEIPMGHWALVGGFIGMTAGISRRPGQWLSFKLILWSIGAVLGFIFGLVFGVLGDIGGFFALRFDIFPMHMREISLMCAGIFINLGAGIAAIFTDSLDNGLWRVARATEKIKINDS